MLENRVGIVQSCAAAPVPHRRGLEQVEPVWLEITETPEIVERPILTLRSFVHSVKSFPKLLVATDFCVWPFLTTENHRKENEIQSFGCHTLHMDSGALLAGTAAQYST